jgi:hypothetical protein
VSGSISIRSLSGVARTSMSPCRNSVGASASSAARSARTPLAKLDGVSIVCRINSTGRVACHRGFE